MQNYAHQRYTTHSSQRSSTGREQQNPPVWRVWTGSIWGRKTRGERPLTYTAPCPHNTGRRRIRADSARWRQQGYVTTRRTMASALDQLATLPQWVCYCYVRRGERMTKPPLNPHLDANRPLRERLASVNNPATWASYSVALARAQATPDYQGVGFVFATSDPFCGIDLDHCRDPYTGTIEPWAWRIIHLLSSYTEYSPSGTGVHIYIEASLRTTAQQLGASPLQHRKDRVELYDAERFFTWTGQQLAGTPTTIERRQAALTHLYRELFPTTSPPLVPLPPAGPALTLDDEELIKRASWARGSGAKFTRLWAGDASAYRRADGSIDQSRADLALLGLLAYWTRKDPSQMERLFRRSGLYRPERWHEPARSGETYGQGSIRVALERCQRVYDPNTSSRSRKAYWRRRTNNVVGKQAFPNRDCPAESQPAGHEQERGTEP